MTRFLTAAVFLVLVPLAAHAQSAEVQIGPLEHDTSQPVEVDSDTLTVDDAAGVAVFQGNVVVVQGAMRLTAPKIRVEYVENAETGRTDITLMHATEGVTFVNGPDAAEGTEAVYRPEEADLVITGDVILTQGPSVMSGEKLVVDLEAGTGVMTGRVKTVFQSGGGN